MHTAAVITISDSRAVGKAEDTGGPAVTKELSALGLEVVEHLLIEDEGAQITAAVQKLIGRVAVIATTGGTGIGPRDVTPEAIEPLFERKLPGFGEIMRTGTYAKTPFSIISRGGAGIADNTLIIMLPGSPKGVAECFELIGPAIKHVLKALSSAKMDCQKEANS